MKMEYQVGENDHYIHILLFTFNQACKAAKLLIIFIYDNDDITERTSKKWFSRSRGRNFALTGRHVLFDEERLKTLLWRMDCQHSTVGDRLKNEKINAQRLPPVFSPVID